VILVAECCGFRLLCGQSCDCCRVLCVILVNLSCCGCVVILVCCGRVILGCCVDSVVIVVELCV
jgi:hypothetical protein